MVPRTLNEVAKEIRRYRRKHGARAHLPRGLRKAAVELGGARESTAVARELGVTRHAVAYWRKACPDAVRVATARPGRTRRTVKAKAKPMATPKRIDFVEIKAPPLSPTPKSTPSSAVEVTRPDGSVVRVTGDLAKDAWAALLGVAQPGRATP